MSKEKNTNKKSVSKAIRVSAIALTVGVVGFSAQSAWSFFTDHANMSKNTVVGKMNMKITDQSDLDGQYGTIVTSGTNAGTVNTALAAKEGYQGVTYTKPAAKDAAKPSAGIINPGDNGIYSYRIESIAEKSFDTAKTVTVTLTATNGAFANDADKSVYTIKGLGTPYVSVSQDKKTCTLKYAQADTQVISGSKEADGAGTTAVYAYDTLFDRNAKNKFQGLTVKIDTTVYAKQHRNGVDSTLSVSQTDGSWVGTGDWTAIGSFETVAD